MAEETETPGSGAYDVVFWVLVGLGTLMVAFMAADVFSQGKATEAVTGLFRKVGPRLTVVPNGGGSGDSDAS